MAKLALLRPRHYVGHANQVTTHELVEAGLERWPDATAVFFFHTQRTLCRDHVETEVTRRLIEVLADSDDLAKVLTDTTTSCHRARRLCLLCPDIPTSGPGGR